ncbi:MAG: hypothetical protein ACXVEX_14055 [Actinomycetota bacterium]
MDDAPSPAPTEGKGIRFIDAMPRPLFVVFVLAAVVAVVAALVFIIHPPESSTVPVAERAPPPHGTLSHDVGTLNPLPIPSPLPPTPPPCDAVARTTLAAGSAGVARLHDVLVDVCRLASGGVAPELTTAITGLRDATVRFAGFSRAGVESTADFATRTIWLNVKFSQESMPVEQVVPVLLHDAWNLAYPKEAVTATQELGARRAEVAACRELIAIDKWPRWCKDARALTDLTEATAIDALVSAGYQR